jgi:adenylate cyclase
VTPGAVRGLAAIGLATCLFALWRVSGLDTVFDGVERAALDLRFRLRGAMAPGPDVLIVGIDERTVSAIGTGAPLRAALADMLDRLAAAGPLAVGVDLLLVDRTPADARLAAALGGADRVVLAAAATEGAPREVPSGPELAGALARSAVPVTVGPLDAMPAPPAYLFPMRGFAGAALIGHANIVEASDRFARTLPLVLPLPDGGWLPALPLQALRRAEGMPDFILGPGSLIRLGDRRIVPGPGGLLLLNHYGGPGTIPTVSFLDLARGKVAPDLAAGRVVFVGSTAESLRDMFATPFSPDMAGVEVLATAFLNLRDGTALRRGPAEGALSVVLAVLIATGGSALMRRGGARAPMIWAAAAVALAFAGVQAAFVLAGSWLDLTAIAGPTLAAVGVTGYLCWKQLRDEAARAVRERDNLSTYVAPGLADLLAGDARPAFDGREQTVTVLFADLAGYTGIAERLPPLEVSALVAHLHGHIGTAAREAGAGIVEFLGDGAMIVFGLPEPAPGDARAALGCAAALVDRPLGEGLATGAPDLSLRVSLHTGPVAVAVLGDARHRHVAVAGDTVNIAARLHDIAKAHHVDLVATRDTLVAAGLPPAAGFRFLATEVLRGRRRPVEIWARTTAAALSAPPAAH